MRKAQNKREIEKRDLADVIEQEKLIEVKGKFPLQSKLGGALLI
jgi:nucleosome binding factor SPN SPT16 subunit